MRGVLMTVLKTGKCVHARYRAGHPGSAAARRDDAAAGLNIQPLADQAIFVVPPLAASSASRHRRIAHGPDDPALPGSWRSNAHHCVSIPLSILTPS